jgi:hypothetical protein
MNDWRYQVLVGETRDSHPGGAAWRTTYPALNTVRKILIVRKKKKAGGMGDYIADLSRRSFSNEF